MGDYDSSTRRHGVKLYFCTDTLSGCTKVRDSLLSITEILILSRSDLDSKQYNIFVKITCLCGKCEIPSITPALVETKHGEPVHGRGQNCSLHKMQPQPPLCNMVWNYIKTLE